jgi:hypothetical protein
MNAIETCWGIYRESAHSPGRIDDDALIMDRVGEALKARGFNVVQLAADNADAAQEHPGANIYVMCERSEILDRLEAATRSGAVVVNSPEAIRNTYRHRMIKLFARYNIPSPASRVVATDTNMPPPAATLWLKRYDFHATQPTDVMYLASADGWREGLRRFASSGIPFVVVQEHVPGDLIKFYGVGTNGRSDMPGGWFEWFYHRDKGMTGHSFDAARLRDVARSAANALGVEIFGGDAIIRPDGEPVIIDLNAWPSFALYRDQAASAIADYLAGRFERRLRIVAR